MNRTITTQERYSSFRKTTYWETTLHEKIYCLYRCDHCGKMILTPVTVHITSGNDGAQSEDSAEDAVVRRADAVLAKITDPDKRTAADLADAHFRQRCLNCRKTPVWTSLLEEAAGRTSRWTILCFIPVAALLILSFSAFESPDIPPAGILFRIAAILLALYLVPKVLPGLIHFRFFSKTERRVLKSLEDTLPLYGETFEQIERQARNTELYGGLPFESIRQRFEENDTGFVIQ